MFVKTSAKNNCKLNHDFFKKKTESDILRLYEKVRKGKRTFHANTHLQVKVLTYAVVKCVPLCEQVLANHRRRNDAQRLVATDAHKRAKVSDTSALKLVAQEIALEKMRAKSGYFSESTSFKWGYDASDRPLCR